MTSALPCPGETAAVQAIGAGAPTPNPGWVLLATIMASSLAFIDGSVVNVALAAIGRSFSAGSSDLQWTVNAYLLPLSALLLLGGAAGDHFGRRNLLVGGTILFATASAACAFAPTIDILLMARAAQGVGAAMLMPNSLAVLGDAFSGEERGRAIGTWASVGAIAGAVGPPLGGWLVESVGWRAIFLINVPVAAVAVLLALRFVKESGQGKQALDWFGAVLATAALGCLTWALTRWSAGHGAGQVTLLTAVAGAAMLVFFLLHEWRRGERAMMPLSMFASKPFVGLTIATLLLYGALGGVLVLLPFMLISAAGYSPFQAGLALLPLPIGIGVASRLMGRLTAKSGPRLPLTIGPVVTGIGFALLVLVTPSDGYWTSVFPGVAVIALGMAGAVAPLTTAVLSSVDARHTGTASGFNSAIARTGGLIATALVGTVMAQAGDALIESFHHAVLAFAALAVAGGVASFLTLARS